MIFELKTVQKEETYMKGYILENTKETFWIKKPNFFFLKHGRNPWYYENLLIIWYE